MTMTTPGRSLDGVARHERVYRRLLIVYPRTFRREYGDDMVQGFRDLLVFNSGDGVWWRALRDLVPSAGREWASSMRGGGEPSRGVIAAIVLLAAAALVFGPGPMLPVFLIPVFVLGVLPVHGLWRFRRAWVVHRTTGGSIVWHLVLGAGSLIVPVGLLLWMGDDAGYWIFVTVGLSVILASGFGILWGAVTLLANRRPAPGRRWVRPLAVLVPSVVVLGIIIGASYNSYRNSLGPPGDHSVANASADTRALWEAAGEGDLDEVRSLTASTCADPWVKFPVGNGRHNAKGWAETRGLQVSGPLDVALAAVADHLGDYMDVWYDRCGRSD